MTISHVNQTSGTATVTINVGAGDNYTASANKTVSVTATFVSALNDCTWAQISDISAKGQGANYWSVGDRKAVQVSGRVGILSINKTLYVYILGFDHNSEKEGTGIQFGTFKTALSGGTDVCLDDGHSFDMYENGTKVFNINHWGGGYNYGGWKACDLRYDILGSTRTAPKNYGRRRVSGDVGHDAPTNTATSPVSNTLMSALPSDLRTVMKPITKYTDNIGGDTGNVADNVTASVDYLPLLSEYEIFGTVSSSNSYERNYQEQYAYYKAGNSKVKYSHSSSSDIIWSERSPMFLGDCDFCCVNMGNIYSADACRSFGLSPVLMV